MINEARRKATGATRRNPASVNDNKAMSSISPSISLSDIEDPPLPFPQTPHFGNQARGRYEKQTGKDLLCGLESELEISSLENSSAVVTFTQSVSRPVFLHLTLTDTSQPGFARSRATKHYFSSSTVIQGLHLTLPQLSPIGQVILIVSSSAMQH